MKKECLFGLCFLFPFWLLGQQKMSIDQPVREGVYYIKLQDQYFSTVQQGRREVKQLKKSAIQCFDSLAKLSESQVLVQEPFRSLPGNNANRIIRIQTEATISSAFFSDLAQSLDIEYIERAYTYQLHFDFTDPLFASQYHLSLIQAEEALGLLGEPEYQATVAVVDDAVLVGHEDLKDVIYTNPNEIANGLDDDGNGYIDDISGWDVSGTEYNNGDPDPNPPFSRAGENSFSHGTHVSGIAAASTNNQVGISSVSANSVRIIPVKTTSDGVQDVRIVEYPYEGVAYAIAAGADVINMSWGGDFFSQVAQDLINDGSEQGVIFVSSAGNSGESRTLYPAGFQNVISVANTNSSDEKVSSSTYGAWVDISAPGQGILSTVASDDGSGGSSYTFYGGTSMSSPLVAGYIGLLKSHFPQLEPGQIVDIVIQTAESIDDENPNYVGLLGSGRINVLNAVSRLANDEPLASFVASSTQGVVSEPITFTNKSLNASSYFWEFGDGATSTEASPAHVYNTQGTYTIRLSINDGAAVIEKTDLVRVAALPPEADTYLAPYLLADGGDFEQSNGGFASEAVTGAYDLWEWGEPGNTLMNVNSGTRAWKTGLDTDIQKDTYASALYTPSFDLTDTLAEYVISFYKSMEAQYCNAPAALQVQYSINGGVNWQRLGEFDDEFGYSWYNKDPDGSCPIESIIITDQQGFLGNFENDSTAFNVSSLSGNSNVRFRFVYYVNGNFSGEYIEDGFMIDDFQLLKNNPGATFRADRNQYYVEQPVNFTYLSGGATSFQWDFGNGQTSVLPDPTTVYQQAGTYTVSLTIGTPDGDVTNSTQIKILPLLELPFRDSDGGDFEDDFSQFAFENVSGTPFELGNSNVSGKSGTSSGSIAVVTGVNADQYANNSEAYLYTPEFAFTTVGEYTFRFQTNYALEPNWDGFIVEYSLDGGDSWQTLRDTIIEDSWYNQSSETQSIWGPQEPIFSGSTGGEFVEKAVDISFLYGQKAVPFRFTFKTDVNTVDAGVAIDDVEILAPNKANASPDFFAESTSICAGDTITFFDQSSGTILDYQWNFGANASPNTATGPGPHDVIFIGGDLQRDISLTVDGELNGEQTITKSDYLTVNSPPRIAGFSIAQDSVCYRDSVTLTIESSLSEYTYQLAGLNTGKRIGEPFSGDGSTLTLKRGPLRMSDLYFLEVEDQNSGCAGRSLDQYNIQVADSFLLTIRFLSGEMYATPGAENYQWFYEGELVQQGDESVYEPNRNQGRYRLVAQLNGCSYETEYNFVLTAANKNIGTDVDLIPNPNQGNFVIYGLSKQIDCSVQVVSSSGKILHTMKLGPTRELNLENLTAGFYFLHIITEEERLVRRLIIN